ncbi:hypothetical protein J4E83_008490 [Alternaria metachromatica]|uniref:uncharacterized protein n=1 Tax=Alternaria metachromatica TaxID=283354 RepID=UPI0020C3B36F|nr:uncharacterized protein J4E83_008490 [Alternaria metachromatica]KAI4609926.1 hypothetical protein J4E83_008490 [Alternaria metachromatica]
MRLSALLSLTIASLGSALPVNGTAGSCSNPRIRKEWRTLNATEQNAYIDAVQCLKRAPSKGTEVFSTLKTRFDDFVALHINATRGGQDVPSLANDPESAANITIYGIHTVGVFLPWHRYAIWVFESVLRSECNYTGAQPYWDWTLDNPSTNANGSISPSPVLKAFGGDGSGTDGCIKDGPFAGNTSLNIGPVESLASNPRCLTRAVDFDLFNGSTGWEDIYPATMEAKNYYQLQAFIDGLSFVKDEDKIRTSAFQSPHGLGHMAIGGDISDIYSSPNDPLFWLHHCQLDYMWTLWQSRDPARLTDIGGPRTIEGFGPPADAVEQTTLDTPVWMGFMAEDVAVREVLDTMNQEGEGVLCYKYEDSPSVVGREF